MQAGTVLLPATSLRTNLHAMQNMPFGCTWWIVFPARTVVPGMSDTSRPRLRVLIGACCCWTPAGHQSSRVKDLSVHMLRFSTRLCLLSPLLLPSWLTVCQTCCDVPQQSYGSVGVLGAISCCWFLICGKVCVHFAATPVNRTFCTWAVLQVHSYRLSHLASS